MTKSVQQLRQEELYNIYSHGIGLLLGIIGFVFLMRLALGSTTPFALVAACCFGISLISVYASSTIYHISKLWDTKLTSILRTVDHINIYYLIAGTYTPFLLLAMIHSNGFSFFIAIWSIAAAGTLYKLIFKQKHKFLSLGIYISMGWIIVLDLSNFVQSTPNWSVLCVVLGGLFYSIGTIFYSKDKLRYNHLYWHLFVLAGSIFHYVAVYILYQNLH